MMLQSGGYCLEISDRGSLVSFTKAGSGENLLAEKGAERPLFTFRLRDAAGGYTDWTAFQAQTPRQGEPNDSYSYEFAYAFGVRIRITITTEDEGFALRFAIENHTDAIIEYIDLPEITVPKLLAGEGGKGRVF